MSALKTNRAIAIGLAVATAVGGTSAAWAARVNPYDGRALINKPIEDRGFKTYLPGEGGCKDDMGFWVAPCGD
jgi:hypothetical protein